MNIPFYKIDWKDLSRNSNAISILEQLLANPS